MGFGICFRGFHGEFIIVHSSSTNAQYSVVEDEVYAILLSLQIAENLGFTHVCFESDSKVIVDAIKDSRCYNNEFGNCVNKCLEIIAAHSDY